MDQATIVKDIAIVCKCKLVKHRTIRLAIQGGATTLEAVREATGANTGCGERCTSRILEMIDEYRP